MNNNTCRKCMCNRCKFLDIDDLTCLIFNEDVNSCKHYEKHKQCPVLKCEHYIYWEG